MFDTAYVEPNPARHYDVSPDGQRFLMLKDAAPRDPNARVDVHNSGKGAKYTRSRLPVSLVYTEPGDSLSAALKRERQVKPWSRAKKEALIAAIPMRSA